MIHDRIDKFAINLHLFTPVVRLVIFFTDINVNIIQATTGAPSPVQQSSIRVKRQGKIIINHTQDHNNIFLLFQVPLGIVFLMVRKLSCHQLEI